MTWGKEHQTAVGMMKISTMMLIKLRTKEGEINGLFIAAKETKLVSSVSTITIMMSSNYIYHMKSTKYVHT